MVLRRILTTAASSFDRTIGASMLVRSEVRTAMDPATMNHEARIAMLEAIRAIYDKPHHYRDPDAFFGAPPIPSATLRRAHGMGAEGTVYDATWPSGFEPFDTGIRIEYLAHEANRTCAARLFLHASARPAVILLHGYRCGRFSLEERIWPVTWLFEQGMDVALAVLPFHGSRATKGATLFPSPDMRLTIEGFRQSIQDVRSLAALLRARGSSSVGVMGMSLGGYTAGLWATLDPSLSFVAPIVPCASIADVARAVGLFVGTPEEQAEQHEALEATLRVTSPLARESMVPPERMLVVGAAGDRITPLDHARRMSAHFRAPLETFHGGHLLQFGRADAFKAIRRMLAGIGLLDGR